jgi:hypothetical protein
MRKASVPAGSATRNLPSLSQVPPHVQSLAAQEAQLSLCWPCVAATLGAWPEPSLAQCADLLECCCPNTQIDHLYLLPGIGKLTA